MRVSKQVMKENNDKIVDEAARLFREKGLEATSVADVMGAAGLTHGGFYRHFSSKNELVSAAIKKSFNDIIFELRENIKTKGLEVAVTNYIRNYLSERHVNNPGTGCPIAALSAEIDRNSKVHRKAISSGSEQLVKILTPGIKGSLDEARTKAMGLISVLVGTLVLARSAKNKSAVKEVLLSGIQLAEFCRS